MAKVTTTRTLDLGQLAREIAPENPVTLSAVTIDGQTEVTCHDDEISQEALQAAVDAHVPDPPPAPLDQQLAALKAREAQREALINELTDLIFTEVLP